MSTPSHTATPATRTGDGTVRALVADPAELDDDALARYYAWPQQPWVRANMVTSLDGAVSLDGRSGPLSFAADRRVFHLLRAQCDALLVGAGTTRVEGYGPVVVSAQHRHRRPSDAAAPDPVLCVVSASLDLDPASRMFTEAPQRPVVLAPERAPADRRAALSEVAEVLTVGEDRVDVAAAVTALHRRGLARILCEGGPTLLGELVAADLLDDLCLTVSPTMAGAGAGRIVTGPPTPPRGMVLTHALVAGDGLLLRYHRAR